MNASNSSNSTEHPMWEPAAPAALQFAFGVIGNAIALVVLNLSSKKHKWRPFYRLVCGLALTDGGGVLLVYPTVMIRYASDFTYEFPKELCDYSSFIYTFTLMSSAMIICAMSFDRFFAILYPFIYNSGNKGLRANLILATIWITGLLLSTLHLMGLGSSYNYYPKSWCFLNFIGGTTKDRINAYIYSVFGLLILISTICINISVILAVCRNMKRIKNMSSRRRMMSDVYIIVFLLVIVIVFSACWAPLMVVIFSHAAVLLQSSGEGGDGPLELLVLRFAVNNSIIDPWIYILLRKENLSRLRRLKRGMEMRLGIINESYPDSATGTMSRTTEQEAQTGQKKSIE